jgi:hypothetical protein
MPTHRAHILLPEDLLREIDAIVGERGRSAFLVETARQEVRRRKLLGFLEGNDPAWKYEDHPELAAGSGDWVSRLRRQSELRTSQRRLDAKAKRRSRTK